MSFVNRQNSLNCLYLNNYSVVYKHVEPVSVVQLKVVVKHGDDLFGHYGRACFPQFICQAGLVDALEQTRSEF